MKKLLKVLLWIVIAVAVICASLAVANKISEAAMIKYIDTFGAVEGGSTLVPEKDEFGNWYFTTDGEFKVLHLTDVHICGGVFTIGKDRKAMNAVAAMVTAEKPDLVVVTGDISFAIPTTGTLNNKYAHEYFKRLMENLGVYWTVTFGNHDSEKYNFHDRAAVAKMYSDESLERCLFSAGPADVFGECNHVINVKNSQGLITESLVMIDTNAYLDEDILGLGWKYDNVRESQVQWYKENIERYSAYNKSVYDALPEETRPADAERYTTVKSMMFMHIPIKEVKYAYDEYVNNGRQNTTDVTFVTGNDGESDDVVYCPVEDEQLFETILELSSTEALFYGHDHLNNFVMEYKGVTLCYGMSIDYSAYFGIDKKGYQRGCNVITCAPDGSFEISHQNYYQDKYQPLYEKESVDMSK